MSYYYEYMIGERAEGKVEFWIILFICGVFGCISGAIANGKGRNFFVWFLYGFVIPLVAIIHAIVLKKNDQALKEEGYKKCPYCAEMIRGEAKVCRYCGKDLPDCQDELIIDEKDIQPDKRWRWDENSLPEGLKDAYRAGRYKRCPVCHGICYENGLACPHCGEKME